jgi:hypothetical protein
VIWNVDGGIVLNGQGQYNAIYNNTVAIDNATIPSGASLIVYSPVSPPSQSSTLISNNIFQPSATLTLSPFETSINSIGQNYQIDASQEAGNPAGFVAWCQQLPGPAKLPRFGPGIQRPRPIVPPTPARPSPTGLPATPAPSTPPRRWVYNPTELARAT